MSPILEKIGLRAWFINLDHRTDRRREFLDRWKAIRLGEVMRVPGVLPSAIEIPFLQGGTQPGGYAATAAHLDVLEQHNLAFPNQHCWILEDDTEFRDDFPDRFLTLMNAVPQDWELIWTGGNYLKVRRVANGIGRIVRVAHTNSYIVRGDLVAEIAATIAKPDGWGIDTRMQRRVQRHKKCYCPLRALTRQTESYSDRIKVPVSTRWGGGTFRLP